MPPSTSGYPYSAATPANSLAGWGNLVMIAIALLNNLKVLIADEPTSALDSRLRNRILELLVEQCEQRQMAMLLISRSAAGGATLPPSTGDVPGAQVDEMPRPRAASGHASLHPYAVDLSSR